MTSSLVTTFAPFTVVMGAGAFFDEVPLATVVNEVLAVSSDSSKYEVLVLGAFLNKVLAPVVNEVLAVSSRKSDSSKYEVLGAFLDEVLVLAAVVNKVLAVSSDSNRSSSSSLGSLYLTKTYCTSTNNQINITFKVSNARM